MPVFPQLEPRKAPKDPSVSTTRNIPLNYLYTVLSNTNLTSGFWMIFLAMQGFSLVQLGILEGVFHITSFAMEVPTGAIADLWGRKASRIAGRLMAIASFIIMLYCKSFGMQLVGFAICALGYNLESGAGDALVYDSLIIEGKEHTYMRVAGIQEFCYQGASVVALLAGGFIARSNFPAVFHISIAIAILSAISALWFVEPPRPDRVPDSNTHGTMMLVRIAASIKGQTVESIASVRKMPRILFLMVFVELIFTFQTSLFFYLQNYWKGTGKTEAWIGLVLASAALVAGLSAATAHVVEKKLGETKLLIILPGLMIACIWGIAATPWSMVFYCATGIAEGILAAAVSTYLNRLIPSENRATILSFRSMLFSLFMIITFPLIGLIGDTMSLPTAFIGMATIATAVFIPYVVANRGKPHA